MNTQEDDKILVEGCLKNQRDSQKKLYEKYAPMMLGICMRYVNCKDEAEDIMVEGFMKVFLSLDSYKEESSLYYWIKKVMVNNAISYYRKNAKHYQSVSIDEVNSNEVEDTFNDMETNINQKELFGIIQEMPEFLRIVMNLRAFDGYSYSQIAEILDISEVTCRTRFCKAKQWLEERLVSESKKKTK